MYIYLYNLYLQKCKQISKRRKEPCLSCSAESMCPSDLPLTGDSFSDANGGQSQLPKALAPTHSLTIISPQYLSVI